MGFIGSTGYYVLCIVALIILVSALVILQLKPRSKPHPKDTMINYQPPSNEHIPKYAAGDDMDRINRKAYALWSEKKPSLIPIPLAALLIFAVIFIAPLSERAKTMTPQPNSSPAPTQPPIPTTTPDPIIIPDGKLQVDLNSAEFNSDRSKIFVTYTYSNESNISFYSIVTKIDLADENDVVIQSKTADAVDSVKPTETKEITTSITIEPENIGKVRRVEIYTNYEKQ